MDNHRRLLRGLPADGRRHRGCDLPGRQEVPPRRSSAASSACRKSVGSRRDGSAGRCGYVFSVCLFSPSPLEGEGRACPPKPLRRRVRGALQRADVCRRSSPSPGLQKTVPGTISLRPIGATGRTPILRVTCG